MSEKQKIKKDNKPKIDYKTETKDQRFIRIAGKRAKNLGKQYNLLIRLSQSPNYAINQENAQKLLNYVEKYHLDFVGLYSPIANGETKSNKEIIIDEVF